MIFEENTFTDKCLETSKNFFKIKQRNFRKNCKNHENTVKNWKTFIFEAIQRQQERLHNKQNM